jgi:putative ABC transport system substrate-binding protein
LGRKLTLRVLVGVSLLLVLALAVPFMTACGGGKEYKIGLTQFATHPAADAGRDGFKKALADAGFVEGDNVSYDYQNPEGDAATEQTIAQKFVNEKVDLIFSFGTRISLQCINAAEGTDIPVVFCAVTDPVGSGLVSSFTHPGENVTGTSDMINVEADVNLIVEIVPGITKLGTLYNAGESNSVVLTKMLKAVCNTLNITVVERTVSTSADIITAAQSLAAADVQAIWVGTDNTVVSGLEAVIGVCESNQIPFFPSDDPSIEKGGVACRGFNYYDVGYQTGEMAVKILKGTPASDVPVELGKIANLLTVNTAAAERYNVTIPQDILDEATTKYTE